MKSVKYIIALLLFTAAGQFPVKAADLNTAINNVVKSYLNIKNALAADNSKEANEEAKKFTAMLKAVSSALTDAKQKAAWNKYAEKLRFDGEHIGESERIAHQREHFGSLSANIYAVLKAFPANDKVLYKQYCPMAKQSWISETAAIKNPYYGKAMTECGVTKETLKAK